MSYRKIDTAVKKECVRLRVEKGYSIDKIKQETGVSQGTLSRLLKSYPIDANEIKQRYDRHCEKKRNETALHRKEYIQEKESQYHKIGKGLSTLQIARVSETAVMFNLLLRGYDVFGSMFDGEKADWIISKADNIYKIQVKTASLPTRGCKARVCTTAGNCKKYKNEDLDFLFAYDFYTNSTYIYKWNEIKGMTNITVEDIHKDRWDKI